MISKKQAKINALYALYRDEFLANKIIHDKIEAGLKKKYKNYPTPSLYSDTDSIRYGTK